MNKEGIRAIMYYAVLFPVALVFAPSAVAIECLQYGSPVASVIAPLSDPSFLSCVTLTTSCTADTNLLFSDFINPPSTPTNFTLSGNISSGANGPSTFPRLIPGLSIYGIPGAGAQLQSIMLCAFEDVIKTRNVTLYTGIPLLCPAFLSGFDGIINGILGPNAYAATGTKASGIDVKCCASDDCNLGVGGMYANGTLFYPGGGVTANAFQPPIVNSTGSGTGRDFPPVAASFAVSASVKNALISFTLAILFTILSNDS